MMQPEIYWIKEFKAVAIMPKPRAGDWLEDEIKGLSLIGVNILVSLLTADEVYELGLKEEHKICHSHGIQFLSFPITDRDVPSSVAETIQLSQFLLTQIIRGKKVAIHCRAGIGRSALMAACILVCSGIEPQRAYEIIAKSRGLKVPDTEAQKQWLYDRSPNFSLDVQDKSWTPISSRKKFVFFHDMGHI
jgi:protein-tyrosine phosphatase